MEANGKVRKMDMDPCEKEKSVRESVEVKNGQRGIFISGMAGGMILLLTVELSLLTQNWLFLLLLLPTAALVTPLILLDVHWMRDMVEHCETYIISETVLAEPKPFFGATMRFSATVINPDGTPVTVLTHAFCCKRGFTKPNFREYNGKRVLVAYDREKSRVVVLRRAGN